MIKYITPVAVSLLLISGITNAEPVKTGAQAATICKAYMKTNVEGLKKARLGKIRSSKEGFKVTFAISDASGRHSTKCLVNRAEGTVTLEN